jgi:predicted NBD/HSP70 family sugar kinase
MNVLVVDVGGSNIKILATGKNEPRKFSSGPKMTAERMVSGVKELAGDWKYEVVSIGYPGPALRDRAVSEPPNLAPGWVGFDFESAFGCSIKLINDAAMQALGSYRGGKLLFLGLGTGLGSAMVAALQPDDVVLGGGNVEKLKELAPGCRAGDNANAFLGGFRMWEDSSGRRLHQTS